MTRRRGPRVNRRWEDTLIGLDKTRDDDENDSNKTTTTTTIDITSEFGLVRFSLNINTKNDDDDNKIDGQSKWFLISRTLILILLFYIK